MTRDQLSRRVARYWWAEYAAGLACAAGQVMHPAGALGGWLAFLATAGMTGGIIDVIIHQDYTRRDPEKGEP